MTRSNDFMGSSPLFLGGIGGPTAQINEIDLSAPLGTTTQHIPRSITLVIFGGYLSNLDI
jgi:hypothetical protein